LFILVFAILISVGRTMEKLTGGDKWWEKQQELEKAKEPALEPQKPLTWNLSWTKIGIILLVNAAIAYGLAMADTVIAPKLAEVLTMPFDIQYINLRISYLEDIKNYISPLVFFYFLTIFSFFVYAGIQLLRDNATWHQERPDALQTPKRVAPPWLPAGLIAGVVCAATLTIGLLPDPTAANIDVTQVPQTIGDWEYVGDIPDTQNAKDIVHADSMLMRQYFNRKLNQEIQLYLVYRKFGRRDFHHRPDLCFPSGGYNKVTDDKVDMHYAGGDARVSHSIYDGTNVLRGDGQKGVPMTTVTFFFASGKRTETSFMKQQLLMSVERILPNKNGWTLVRLTSPRRTTDDDALAAQKDFMQQYGDAIQQVITTDK
jgi:EpsI family protein